MREKKGRRNPNPETQDPDPDNSGKAFFACYILTSLSPRHKGHTYIGFTVNPKRRIRQHNGEITSGAYRTKRKRPWEMVLCIYGFPTNVSALQFEWAWQHPRESLAVREAASAFKSFSGLASKIKLAYTMLNLPSWNSLNLTVNYFSTKYAHHGGVCPSLPLHMKVQVCPMDNLPCFAKVDNTEEEESPEGHGEDDNTNQSQPWSSKELQDRHFEKGIESETVFDDDDRLANFTGFGLLDEESHEEEGNGEDDSSNQSQPGSSKELQDGHFDKVIQPENVFDDDECVLLDEESPDSSNQPLRNSSTISSNVLHTGQNARTVFDVDDRLANFTGFGLLDENVEHGSTQGCDKSMEKDCWRRSDVITSTSDVEVIDLMTPSPTCRVGSMKKRSRVSDFIDLTMSPSFIDC